MTIQEQCSTCKYAKKLPPDPQGRHGFICQRSPPVGQAVMVASGQPGQQAQFQNVTNWPIVGHDQWCGEWKIRLETATALPPVNNRKAR